MTQVVLTNGITLRLNNVSDKDVAIWRVTNRYGISHELIQSVEVVRDGRN